MILSTKHGALGMLGLVLALATMVSTASASPAQSDTQKETYSCFAVSMGNLATGSSGTVQINITRWTTNEERKNLIDTLVENGSDELLKTLQQEEETGFMRLVGTAARLTPFPTTRLHYAYELREGGKRIIRLVTDRPISFYEARSNPRSMEYNFTIIELRLDEKNEGEGTLAVGVKMSYDRDRKTIVLENYSSEPIRLSRVSKSN